MKISAICLLLFIMAIVVLGSVPAQNASKRSFVGYVTDEAIVGGCGCYFKFRRTPQKVDRYLFASSIEEDVTALMNIDGSDVKLKLVKGMEPKGTQERVGSRRRETYVAGEITVTGNYVVTRVCAPNDENCESTDYDVTFQVKKGSKSQLVKASGYCGC
jgi:hypothetical protein